jgi:hypothetical protein
MEAAVKWHPEFRRNKPLLDAARFGQRSKKRHSSAFSSSTDTPHPCIVPDQYTPSYALGILSGVINVEFEDQWRLP